MSLVYLYIDYGMIYELFDIILFSQILFKFFLRVKLPCFRAG